MNNKTWQLQEAKSKFSKLVDEAQKDGPQIVTKHGDKAVVVIDFEEYKKLTQQDEGIVSFFRNSPLAGVELGLERDKSLPRDIDL